MPDKLRMYQGAWFALKSSLDSPKRIVIAANKKLHPRIFKAIVKEKDMDVVYKLQLSDREIPQRAWLSKCSNGGQLVITLKFSIGKDDF